MSPAPATSAEEAMAPSGERTDSRQPAPDLPPLHRPVPVSPREPAGMAANGREESGAEAEPWAATVPPVRLVLIVFFFPTCDYYKDLNECVYMFVGQEWVPIIRHDMLSQRKIKAQPPLSDAYLHGMPAKRRKVGAHFILFVPIIFFIFTILYI